MHFSLKTYRPVGQSIKDYSHHQVIGIASIVFFAFGLSALRAYPAQGRVK
jgi:hypothetical protein